MYLYPPQRRANDQVIIISRLLENVNSLVHRRFHLNRSDNYCTAQIVINHYLTDSSLHRLRYYFLLIPLMIEWWNIICRPNPISTNDTYSTELERHTIPVGRIPFHL